MSIHDDKKNGRTAGAQRHLVRPSCTNHLQSHAEETHGRACSNDDIHNRKYAMSSIFTANSWSVSGVHLLIHLLVPLVEDTWLMVRSPSPTLPTGHPVERRMANKWMPSAGIWHFGSGKIREIGHVGDTKHLAGRKISVFLESHIELS